MQQTTRTNELVEQMEILISNVKYLEEKTTFHWVKLICDKDKWFFDELKERCRGNICM